MDVYAYYNLFKGGLSDKAKLKEYAKAHNYKIVSEYSDNGIYTRDGIYKLLKRIQKSDIKSILVYSLDHLWSDEELHYLLVSKLKKLGAEIISVTEPPYCISTDNIIQKGKSVSNYIKMLLPSVSAINLTQGRLDKGQQGYKPCGIAPLGYMWNNDGDIILNDDEAATVNIIFKKYLIYKSLSKLAEYLSANNIKSKNDKQFSRAALNTILRNDFYIGVVTYQGEKIKGRHMPIVDKDLFYEAGQLLSSNAKCTKKQR